MTEIFNEKREYRIVTGGEDGMIIWWNLVAPFNADLSCLPNLSQDQLTKVMHVKPSAELV